MSIEAISWAWKQQTGNGTLKAVLLAIANYADENGQAWPSQARLAKLTEFSERTIIRAIQELEQKGYLETFKRNTKDGRQTNVMRLKRPPTDSVSDGPQVTACQVTQVTGCPKVPDRVSPKPIYEPPLDSVATATDKNPVDFDKLLFDEGKKIASGSMVSRLKKACRGDPVQALEIVRLAAGRSNPMEYLSAAMRQEEARNDKGQRHRDALARTFDAIDDIIDEHEFGHVPAARRQRTG